MIIIGILFFIFGFVTWLNGSLIPFLKVICELSDFESLFVTFSFYIAYTVMAFPMASILERVGYKSGMVLGLGVMAFGSVLFIPAALSAEFWLFLVALFTLGTGLTLLQTASNPYIVLLGPIESAAMRISIMGVINKSAGVLAPLIFSVVVFSGLGSVETLSVSERGSIAQALILPYLILAFSLVGLAFFVKLSSLEELVFERVKEGSENIFAKPRVVLGAIALFFYVGIEVIAGDTIGLYAQSLGIVNATALTSYTMLFMVFSYLLGIFFIPRFISQKTALVISSMLGVFFLFGVAFSSTAETDISDFLWGWSGIMTLPNTITFVALLGFANALVWPTIWPLALEDLTEGIPKASALLIMAIAGGALLPLLFGKIAAVSGMQMAYLYGVLCYGVILFYALKGHQMKVWRL